uniref:Uncharacterized protein n=1 Tax=Arundo donax TaxID=35708 RepID=A0A0A9BI43_ARUDO
MYTSCTTVEYCLMSSRSTRQMTQPRLIPPLTFAAAYARQLQLLRHTCLHCSSVMPAYTVAFVASGSFIRFTTQNPSVLALPLPQPRLVLLTHPPVPSRRLHCCGDRGENPGRQLQSGDWAVSQYPNGPQVA